MIKMMCDSGDDAKLLVECLGNTDDDSKKIVAMCLYSRDFEDQINFDGDVRFVTGSDFQIHTDEDDKIEAVSVFVQFFNSSSFEKRWVRVPKCSDGEKLNTEFYPLVQAAGSYGNLKYKVDYMKMKIENEGDFYVIINGDWWCRNFAIC